MIVVILLVAAALAVCLLAAKTNPGLRPLAGILGVALIALAGWHVYSTLNRGGTYSSGPESALGYVLGERVARDFPAGGVLLAVHEEPLGPKEQKAANARMEGLRSALSGSGLEVVPIYFKPGEDAFGEPGTGFPVTDCSTWVETHSHAVAAVSFSGFPDRAKPAECAGWPPFYVFASGAVHALSPFVRRGRIKALVVYRPNVNPTQKIPKGASPQELFDLRYEFAAGQ